jgi:hypothetical protein
MITMVWRGWLRQIAAKTGESLTGAIPKALQEQRERLQTQVSSDQVADILRRVDALPTLDSRPHLNLKDEILGYDEHGLAQ